MFEFVKVYVQNTVVVFFSEARCIYSKNFAHKILYYASNFTAHNFDAVCV